MEHDARDDPGPHAGRFVRRADQPVARLSGHELPSLDARGLLPAGRRLRLSRSVAGRDGAAAGAARARQSASAPRRRPAVRRRRRPALVARAERPRPAFTLLGRSAVAAVRGRRSTSARRATSGVLDERVPFLEAPLLAPDAHEAYGQPRVSSEDGTLFEHCVRAIDKGLTAGAHGLPLIGTGDWNDGMNRVGPAGRGESTWLGFFLHTVLSDFVPLCRARKDDGPGGPVPERSAAARGQARTVVGRRVVPARVLRRRHAARIGAERRVQHRLDLAVVGGPLGRRPDPLCRARHGRGAHVARRARIADAAAAQSAVRSVGAGSGLHQGLSAGRPGERRPVHARGRLDRDGAGPTRQRRRGRGILPHAEPGQPRPHGGGRGPLQDGAVRDGRRRLRAAAARRTRRLELVHADRPAGCIAPASRASSACGGAATRSSSTRAFPRRGPSTGSTWRFLDSRYEITVSNPTRRCRGVATATLDGAPVNAAAIPLRQRRPDARRADRAWRSGRHAGTTCRGRRSHPNADDGVSGDVYFGVTSQDLS